MLSFLNTRLLGPALPVFLCAAGVYLLFRLRFFLLLHPVSCFRALFRRKGNGTPLRGMLTALAGTLGVGNITGVAAAITAGGAGAVFWMWVSAFFAMLVKYAETVLACLYRRREKDGTHGGAYYYLRDGLKKPRLAAFFALLLLLSTFFVGNFTQTAAAAETAKWMLHCPRPVTGILLSLLLYLVIAGGGKRIGDFAVRLIPLLTGVFVLLSSLILIRHRAALPAVFARILREAFRPEAGYAGIGGFLWMKSVRFGTARGIFSNEAGCGTSPTAHAANAGDGAVEQGLFGILEVFVDTVLLCTLTALPVLLAVDSLPGIGETELAILSFDTLLGPLSARLLALSVPLYALASTVAWAFYGEEALRFLGGSKKADHAYRLLYALCCFAGAILPADTVWELSDLFVSLMTFVNTAAVLRLSGQTARETSLYFSGAERCPPHRKRF